ncbi:MAG: type II toxin-antitoxin system prevent-host-death family antitoxin [Gammaproteobacteria bacterium]|nr:type II toxin-antitoxin system prevent-host-death family antitoxin [Gammaproteobacteria bacterium]
MSALSASDAKREFGDLLLKAQKEPVKINKNGKPVAVVVSATEYEQLEVYRDEHLRAEIEQGIADLEAGNVSNGVEVLKRLRKRVT